MLSNSSTLEHYAESRSKATRIENRLTGRNHGGEDDGDEDDDEDALYDDDDDDEGEDENDGLSDTLNIDVRGRSDRVKKQERSLTRMQTVQQLFHAFCNRTEAYGLPHHVALIIFGTNVDVACEFTPLFDTFKEAIDNISPAGDTQLIGAIELARKKLESYCVERGFSDAECRKRILVLSDGEDNKSQGVDALALSKALIANKVVVDAVFVGDREQAQQYGARKIALATGGYAFAPETLREALSIFESETVLAYGLRDCSSRPIVPPRRAQDLERLGAEREWDTPRTCRPAPEPSLRLRVQPLAQSMLSSSGAPLGPPAGATARSSASTRRILHEMRALLKPGGCNPAFDIYPALEDIGFWRAVVSGPTGTPYQGGTWLLFILFPLDYPTVPPTVRFVTEILHCNINSSGRICHSILSQNWTESTSIKLILDCISGLLLVPDKDDPLDSTLALAAADDSGLYEVSYCVSSPVCSTCVCVSSLALILTP